MRFLTILTAFLLVTAVYAKKAKHETVSDSARQTEKAVSGSSSATTAENGKVIHTGPKGGQYYINKNGKKTYIKRKK